MSTMPQQRPGRSRQDYRTPQAFLDATTRLLGIGTFACDLAASIENAVTIPFYSEEDDSLIQNWVFEGWGWCNPPYGDIEPWVSKAWISSRAGAKTAMLVPASVGSNWWATWVHGKAYVHLLNGRLTFTGATAPYPKDCVLLLYAPFLEGGYTVWDWSA